MMPTRFDALPIATWPRLRNLLDGQAPGGPVINMTIGEPKHKFPDWVGPALVEAMEGFNSYPDNNGTPELRAAITGFLRRRYAINLDMDNQVMVLNGTREGLFNAVVALGQTGSKILIPNPFYQVYTVAAMAIGAQSVYLPAWAESGFLPDLDALTPEELNQTSVFFLCSPSNPQGVVASEAYWNRLLTLAETYDFKIFADECYSEIYRTAPPPGALQVAAQMGADPERVVAFHSLSKRSNLPGLRSGFVASGSKNISRIKQLRAYAGCPVAGPIQHISAKVWADDDHVVANRQLYCGKFEAADRIFAGIKSYNSPEAGFFLWLPVEDDEAAASKLWTETGLRVLPGSYLGQIANEQNPGSGYIRVALVAPKEEMQRGLNILRDCLYK
jgi:aspartate/methionine/tyrosine aminotransferase